MIVGWKTRTWGTPASDVYVLALPGIEDRILNAANLTGGRDVTAEVRQALGPS